MNTLDFGHRQSLADKLRSSKAQIAELITTQFIEQHPEWKTRYTDAGRKSCLEDACYHVDFLASAIEAGSAESFKTYVRWLCNVLRSRNVPAECVSEHLSLLGGALDPHLDEVENRLTMDYLSEGRAACDELDVAEMDPHSMDTGLELAQKLYLQAILTGQRKAAVNVALELLRSGTAIQDVYVAVLQESLYEVGRLWESNKITVAEEHMATAITQFVIAQLYSHIEPFEHMRGVAVVAGVRGELHQVGANMVADVMDIDGWEVHFLGTNMPHEGILSVVRDKKATLLGISSTMLFNMPQVVQLIQAARKEFGDSAPRIIVGGGAFRQAPELWREIGADGFAVDLRSALEVSRQHGSLSAAP
jgi:methanogenic corrinoid protein MtbC1